MSKISSIAFADHEAASACHAPSQDLLDLTIPIEMKWIAVSQMQKAIRRSQVDIAVAWCHALWQADRSYGLFRLAVIAAEEVAGANPALARAFLQSEIKKTWFDERGGFSCVAYFVEQFAKSTKDRTSCDLASVASLSHLPDVTGKGELDYSSLRSLATDSAAPTPARVSAFGYSQAPTKSPTKPWGKTALVV